MFSCIFGEGYSNTHEVHQRYCVFNRNEDACRYGSAIGVLAFLACAFFLVVDVYFPQISNAVDRKYLVISDLLFSGTCRARPLRRSRGLRLRGASELVEGVGQGAGRGVRSPWSRQARTHISNHLKPTGAEYGALEPGLPRWHPVPARLASASAPFPLLEASRSCLPVLGADSAPPPPQPPPQLSGPSCGSWVSAS